MTTAVALKRYEHYIDGAWVSPAGGEYIASYNPATAEPWYEIARGTKEDVERAVKAARAAFENPAWANLSQTARGKLLRKLGDLIGDHADELGRIESLDNGKLLREMGAQLRGLPDYYYYFSGIADKIEGAVIPGSRREILNYTLREPLGVVGAIVPWNSPLSLASSKIAPALATGNTIVLKPSEHTSASLLELMKLVDEAGFPHGVVNVVTGYGEEAGAALTRHPGVDKVAFTGGSDTGSMIAKDVGARLGRVTLELGGKSPNIVFADADPHNAAIGIIAGIFAAAGQTCIAGSRVFLHEKIHDEVLGRVIDRTSKIKIGDPLLDDTELGPLAIQEQLEKVKKYVDIGANEGAKLVYGGTPPPEQRQQRRHAQPAHRTSTAGRVRARDAPPAPDAAPRRPRRCPRRERTPRRGTVREARARRGAT